MQALQAARNEGRKSTDTGYGEGRGVEGLEEEGNGRENMEKLEEKKSEFCIFREVPRVCMCGWTYC